MSTKLHIAVAGASGRMGRMLIEAVMQSPDCQLSGALDREGSLLLGQDAGAFLGRESGVRVTSDLREGLAGAQVLVVEGGEAREPALGDPGNTRPRTALAHVQKGYSHVV